jgi:hypothetical protein
MLSEWLELDSEDDWVRHDAETVSIHATIKLSNSLSRARLYIKSWPTRLI